MNFIFWGFFFVILDFNINIGNSSIGLLPDFIGFYLIYKGAGELRELSPNFQKVTIWANCMVYISAAFYLISAIGVPDRSALSIAGIFPALISIYIQYRTVRGILDLEETQSVGLNGRTLFLLWKVSAIFSLLPYLTFFVPTAALVFLLLSCAINIGFLFQLYQTKKLYEQAGLM